MARSSQHPWRPASPPREHPSSPCWVSLGAVRAQDTSERGMKGKERDWDRVSGATGMARGRRGRRSSKVDAQRRVFHFAPPGAQLWAQHPKRDERVVGALLSRCGEGRLGVSQGSSELGGDPPDMAPTHRQRAGAPQSGPKLQIFAGVENHDACATSRLNSGIRVAPPLNEPSTSALSGGGVPDRCGHT